MSGQAKRRRTSNSSYVAINADEDQEHAFNKPTTPKRASYLSPTKASLSRTNPQLLQNTVKAKASRESEPNRRQSLRDAVLGNRSLPSREDRTESPHPVHTPDSAVENVPPALSKPTNTKLTTPDLSSKVDLLGRPQHENNGSNPTSLVRSRNSYTPRRNRSHSFMSPPMIPKLVESPRRQRGKSPSPEVELPPTPVQLGKGQSDRPRGLHSSSPGGSAGRRVRMRGGNIYTSPLKPIAMPPLLSENQPQSDVVIASGLGEEDQEYSMITGNERNGIGQIASAQMGDEEQAEYTEPAGDDSRIEERKAQLDALQSELSALKQDLEELQTFRSTLGRSRTANPDAVEPGFELILKDIDLNASASTLPTDDNVLFRKHPLPYISLFSPTNLTMSYQFWDQTVSAHTAFVYQTTVVASPPWPGDALSLTFDIATDPLSDMVESIALVSDNKRQPELSRWIQRRLEAPLHKNGIAAIISGISSFFEAATERARIWYFLIEPSVASNNKGDMTGNGDLTSKQVLTKEEVSRLLPYINTKQHTFTPAGSNQRVRRSLGGSKQLMLTYEIQLDWLGRVNVQTDILTTGLNTVTAEAASKLFQEVKNVAGVSDAFKHVREILEMDGKASEQVKTNMKTKKGKARRMTAFE